MPGDEEWTSEDVYLLLEETDPAEKLILQIKKQNNLRLNRNINMLLQYQKKEDLFKKVIRIKNAGVSKDTE